MPPSESQTSDLAALEKLKSILISPEQKRLGELESEIKNLSQNIEDKERFIETLDPVIADLLYQKIAQNPDAMAEIFAPLIGSALKKQVEETKEDVVDALYPVIGKAVRKSIAEAMKNLLQVINDRLDKAVSFNLFNKPRLDKKKFAEILPFSINELFIIHKQSGLLVEHISIEKSEQVNQDIISSMLTAIKDFSKSAFKTESREVNEIQYEDMRIVFEEGRYFYLAAVINGVVPAHFKEQLQTLENTIHLRYFKQFRSFEGDVSAFNNLKELCGRFVLNVNQPEQKSAVAPKRKPLGLLYAAIILIIIISAGWFVFYKYLTEYSADKIISSVLTSEQSRHVVYTENADNINISGFVNSPRLKAELSEKLNAAGFDVNEERLYIFDVTKTDSIEQLLKTQIDNNQLHIDNIRIFPLGIYVVIEGQASDEQSRMQAGLLVKRLFDFDLLINNLTIEHNQKPDTLIFRFDAEETNFSEKDKKQLEKLLTSSVYLKRTFHVIGHSDSSGLENYYSEFAAKRAQSATEILISMGVSKDKIKITNRAAREPLFENKTAENRAKNRRVEIIISNE